MKLYKTDTQNQREAFLRGDIHVAVYGLGKMGLPLAGVFADVSGNVVGVDIDSEVVDAVNNGRSHFAGEPGLDELIGKTVQNNQLRATTESQEVAAESSVHVIIIPTLVDSSNNPDLSILKAVTEDIATGLESGDIVIIESTVPPKTSESVIEPLLAEKSVLNPSEFGVAFCPERTSSGRAIKDLRGAYPKVVGGTDEEATRVAELIYDEINSKGAIPVTDATTAEAVKVFEGVYRDVNIALANELAKLTDELGIDVTEATQVANTLPMCDIHDPGAGVGGHCIPFYPYFLIKQFEGPTPLLETAREINDSMPEFVINKLIAGLTNRGKAIADSTVVVLGLTYRPGVPEIRHAPSISIVDQLVTQNADVFAIDPVLEDFSDFEGASEINLAEMPDVNPDAVVLVTNHPEFSDIRWERFAEPLVIVDGRQALDIDVSEHFVYTIGEKQKSALW